MTQEPSDAPPDDRELARGAVVNFIGLVAKAAHPLFLLLIVRLYGLSVYGVFAVALNATELLSSLLTGGYKTGIILYGGRYGHRGDDASQALVYRAMANALVIVGAVSAAVVPLAALVGDELLRGAIDQPGVGAAFAVLALALPFLSVTELAVAATKSRMIMKYDALLLGFARPVLMVICAVLAYVTDPSLRGLAWSFVAAHALLAAFAVAAFARHFSLRRLLRATVEFSFFAPLTKFALPQTAHMTLADSTTKVDVMMLAAFQIDPALVGLYDVGGKLVRVLRQVKLGFSNALAPLIARLHEDGNRAELEHKYTMVSRWSAAAAMPLLLAIAGLGELALRAFVGDVPAANAQAYDGRFLAVLTIHPLLVAILGLAGNVLVMTGHSRLVLVNSAVAVAVNVALNLVLIPRHGLLGAALASAGMSVALHVCQLIEVRALLALRLRWRSLLAPLGAGALGGGALLAVWLALDGGASAARAAASTATGLLVYGGIAWQTRDRAASPASGPSGA